MKKLSLLKRCIIEDDQDELDVIFNRKQRRRKKYKHDRLDMDRHFEMCELTNGFQRRYHMSRDAFDDLVRILNITVDEARSRNSTEGNEPISPVMIVAMGIRFMGGEEVKSIADIFGVSISSVDRVVALFLDAVESSANPMLSIDLLPISYQDRMKMAEEWSNQD